MEKESAPRVIAVVGPTATGKSELGVRLAEALGGEVINADALQVYRELEIGTAKPPPNLREAVPHHLIDILDPTEVFSAGEFVRRARPVIEDIHRRGRRAILVGGSGFYLRSLLEGLGPVPTTDPAVRAEVARRTAEEGLPAIYRELQAKDPESAARLWPGDRQRVQRALEVVLATGIPLSRWIHRQGPSEPQIPSIKIGLTLERGILYDRISGRVQRMVKRGWIEEVEGLLDRGYSAEAPAFQAIGYRQVVAYVSGKIPLEKALEETVRATRRYAKRQLTWFRKEPNLRWVPALDIERSIPSLIVELSNEGAVAR
jgi:tRNA dimethylallyltransferase